MTTRAGPLAADRRDVLAANLADVRRRIDAACERAGRRPEEVTLIAVTKTFPASDVRLLHELGIREVGENRDQEAAGKAAELADLDLVWHFVGRLQTNKCRSVARYADVIQSVDRRRLVAVLGREAEQAGRTLRCLVQVSLDPQPTGGDGTDRGGAAMDDVPDLADAIARTPGLRLGGVMGIAPLPGTPGSDPGAAFRRLVTVARAVVATHPDAVIVSAGMSGDLEQAVEAGATHLRVGTALLGDRRPPVG